MKKWGSIICSVILSFSSVFGVVRAENPKNDDCREIIKKMADYSGNFRFDKDYNMSTDARLEEKLLDKPLSDVRNIHCDRINKLLADGAPNTYDCRVWTDWLFCELRNHHIECEQITVTVGDDLKKHFAILMPQVESGAKNWYVCDLFLSDKMPGGHGWLFKPLEDYMRDLGVEFKGAMVNDDDFVCFSPSGIGSIGGRDIYVWLIENGENVNLVNYMLKNRCTDDIKFMSSLEHADPDYCVLRSKIDELKVPYSRVSYIQLKV